MYIIATASADTYITNKIVDGLRTEDANVGRAGTLDLFKLYDETMSGSTGGHTELSRLLIKFDLGRARSLASSSLDFSSNTFGAKVRLQQVQTNLPVPRNFTVSVFPLARAFSEGDGRDVSSFADVDVCNFISASAGVGWSISGAYDAGDLSDLNVDYYQSGDLQDGFGNRSLEATQLFIDGTEDLFVDVTDVVSATLAGIIPDFGMIMSFTSSQESDAVTRFVKRFASRHVTNESIRPRLELFCNQTTFDSHGNAKFDASGSLFLRNSVGGSYQDILSASVPLTGSSCMKLILSTGSYANTIAASQQSLGTSFVAGTYLADFFISAQDQSVVSGTVTLADHIAASGTIVFSENWKSLDESITFLSTFLTCSIPSRTTAGAVPAQLNIRTTNAKSKYGVNSTHRLRVFAYDSNYEPAATRIPKPTKSATPETYYSVIDSEGSTYIPFERSKGGTRLSFDSDGMFFDLYTDGLPSGKLFSLRYLVVDGDTEYTVDDRNVKFIVEK